MPPEHAREARDRKKLQPGNRAQKAPAVLSLRVAVFSEAREAAWKRPDLDIVEACTPQLCNICVDANKILARDRCALQQGRED